MSTRNLPSEKHLAVPETNGATSEYVSERNVEANKRQGVLVQQEMSLRRYSNIIFFLKRRGCGYTDIANWLTKELGTKVQYVQVYQIVRKSEERVRRTLQSQHSGSEVDPEMQMFTCEMRKRFMRGVSRRDIESVLIDSWVCGEYGVEFTMGLGVDRGSADVRTLAVC